ncbi:CDP-glycerol glycerophosphotransferase family protein [Halalkalibacter alkalisediminis]|uniref:CDP-glycerol glycerophosphotransferase family protein n=1 Tax=Halalkalibacter alkalisediminis TaxID=935616 RepID=A0ABV6NEP7_9BACI|nr:CDP-glycerol glycerophosphotransferase family protein [Halalkalibacter alkalisediminis]
MNGLKEKLKKSPLMRRVFTFVFICLSFLPVKKKLILFESFSGKQYSCNPRAIYEYLSSQNQDYEMVWSANKNVVERFKEAGVPYVERLSPKWFLLAARAKFWVTNSRMPSWVPKPRHTVYVQTWHGTPLKKLVADMEEVHMPGTSREQYIRNFHNESKNWDYLISPNEYSTEIFKRAFHFNKDMIVSGYPRNDVLITQNSNHVMADLKQKLKLPTDKKILLYAPTWRDNEYHGPGKYKINLQLDFKKMQEQLGSDYILLLRLHSFVSDQVDLSGFEGFVYDFSKYLDINDLFLVSDVLITDYSSVFFDYANLKRPMIFFTYDIEAYRNQLRGFYFDFETNAPGPIVLSTDEVITEIKKSETHDLAETYHEFHQKFCYLEDGNAARRVAEKIFLNR